MTSALSFGATTALARHERDPAQQCKIVLKSCYGKTGHKLRLEPCKDGRTGRFLGVDNLSEEEKRKTDYVVEPGVTYLEITDGFEFDLTDPRQAKNWKWVKECPQIVGGRNETNFHMDAEESRSFEGSDNEFYVFDQEADTVAQETQFDKQFTALKHIHELKGSSAIYQTARLLGSNMESSSIPAVRTFLLGKAQKHPEQILKVAKDGSSKVRLFLYAALDKEVIRKRAGVFYYNETALGTTEDQVMLWLGEDRNYTLVRAMQLDLYPTTRPKTQVSQANQELFNRSFDPITEHDAGALQSNESAPTLPTDSVPDGSDFEVQGEDEDLDANDPTRESAAAAGSASDIPLTRAAQLAQARAKRSTGTPTV